MTIAARDAWEDARTAATEPFLEGEVAKVRRRLWLRQAGVLVLVAAAVGGLFLALGPKVDRDADELWHVPPQFDFVGFVLIGVGFVVMCIGWVRSFNRGTGGSFIRPELYLPRADRAWLRRQIAEGRPVPAERRSVVSDAARRLVAETSSVPTLIGSLLVYCAIVVTGPLPSTFVVFAALAVWMVVQIVRTVVWAGRARRWLALDA